MAVALAVLSCGHAASQFLAQRQPVLGAKLSPLAPASDARLAVAVFPEDPLTGRALARRARIIDPLEEGALAVLARATPDDDRRRAILAAGEQVTRRGQYLLPVRLAHAARTGDRQGFAEAVDRILGIYPGAREQIMSVATGFLARPDGLQVIRELLAEEPEWTSDFFVAASARTDSGAQLRLLHSSLAKDITLSQEAQSAVMRAFVRDGFIQEAHAIYSSLAGDSASGGSLDWSTRFAPFDWQFANQPGVRLRTAAEGNEVELLLRWNRRGVMARKLLVSEAPIGRMSLEADLGPADLASRLSVQLSCAGGSVIASLRLSAGGGETQVPEHACEVYSITLFAGAPARSGTLRGSLGVIRLETR